MFSGRMFPPNIELLYYAFHVMAGLGTMFIVVMALANMQRLRGRLEASPRLLWVLMLAFPFPYIANTAGWMTTELGRQPWLIYGLYRTQAGYSDVVSSGNVLFTLIGMTGLYFVLGLLQDAIEAGGADRIDMARHSRAIKTLMMPGGLGSTHKVLILGKGVGKPALRGCSFRQRVT